MKEDLQGYGLQLNYANTCEKDAWCYNLRLDLTPWISSRHRLDRGICYRPDSCHDAPEQSVPALVRGDHSN